MTRRKYEFNVLKPKASVRQHIVESVAKQKSSFHFTGVSLLLFFIWVCKLPRKCLLCLNKRPIFFVRLQKKPSPFLSADQKSNKNPCVLFPR